MPVSDFHGRDAPFLYLTIANKNYLKGKNTMKRRLLSIVLALCMLLSVVPMFSITASAEEAVAYRYPIYNKTDGTFYENASSGIKEWKTGSCTTYTEIDSITWGTANTTTWYVVTETTTIQSRATVTGDVHLILKDGVTLTCSQGITVSVNNSLTVYAQSTDVAVMGKLIAMKDSNRPGIGSHSTAMSGYITINGGKVKATGAGGCAGIGGYDSGIGSNITINGGEVEAIGGSYSNSKAGAGIGGGYGGSGSNITINGGTVTATGGYVSSTVNGAGIGGGAKGSAVDITINGGTVIASGGGDKASGIGGGQSSKTSAASSSKIYVAAKLTVKAGKTSSPTTVIASDRTNDTDIASYLKGQQYATITPPPTYAVTEATCTNGSVSVGTVKEFASGETVTVTPTASTGYVVDKVYYTPAGGTQTEITLTDNKYTFTMPSSAVTVSATFKLPKNKVSEDITISFKNGYTPTAGDTIATLMSNVVYSNTTLFDYYIYVLDSEYELLSESDTLKAGETYSFLPDTIVVKDSTNYEFATQPTVTHYAGTVTVLENALTYQCGEYVGTVFYPKSENPNAIAFDFVFNTGIPTFTVQAPIPEAVKDATYSASLTLGKNIDVNFKMGNIASADKDKLSITVDGTPVSFDYKDGVASCVLKAVEPKDIGTPLHIVITYDGVTVKNFNYSVLNYCNAVYNHASYLFNVREGEV